MPDIWTNVVEAAQAMSLLEVGAILFSAVCVFLATKRNVLTYPIGIVGTVLFFFVFWNIGLYSSAILQVFFTGVQIYGWWYWLHGDHGFKPRITTANRSWWIIGGLFAIGAGIGVASVMRAVGASMPGLDALIFSTSVVAQFFMDRKKLESWIIWGAVNVASIIVYGSLGLVLTSALYVGFLLNAVYGYLEWRKELRAYAEDKPSPTITEIPTGATLGQVVQADVIPIQTPKRKARKPKMATS